MKEGLLLWDDHLLDSNPSTAPVSPYGAVLLICMASGVPLHPFTKFTQKRELREGLQWYMFLPARRTGSNLLYPPLRKRRTASAGSSALYPFYREYGASVCLFVFFSFVSPDQRESKDTHRGSGLALLSAGLLAIPSLLIIHH